MQRTIYSFYLLIVVSYSFSQVYSSVNKKAIKLYKSASEEISDRRYDEGLLNLEKCLKIDPNFNEARFLYAKSYSFLNFNTNSDRLVKYHYQKIYLSDSNNVRFFEVYMRLLAFAVYDKEFSQAQFYLNTVNRFPGDAAEYKKELEDRQRLIFSAQDADQRGIKVPMTPLNDNVNSGNVQFRPFLTADEEVIVFTAKHTNNEDVFVSKKVEGEWTLSTELFEGLNTKNNEGLVTISADGKFMVFASTKVSGFGKSDLYSSFKKNQEWSAPKNMGGTINSKAFDSEPALSADGRILYYSSSRKGGFGGKDLYVSKRDDYGKWSPPVNLGGIINTKGNEVTPFIHADKRYLYFASDGHKGLGGYDLYYAAKKDSFNFDQPINLGYPINTEKDEGSLFVNLNYEQAYMDVYDYQGRYSTCMIYQFDFPQHLMSKHKSTYARGFVYDSQSSDTLEAVISLIDLVTGKVMQQVSSDRQEGFLIVLPEDRNCALRVEKKGYLFYSASIDFRDEEVAVIDNNIGLVPISGKGATVVLENLYFEPKQFELKPSSESELYALVNLLRLNPTLRIKIRGYTDNIGNLETNQILSERRALAVVNFLESRGIPLSRLQWVGYGEGNPRSSNKTERGRSLNRRIEIEVL